MDDCTSGWAGDCPIGISQIARTTSVCFLVFSVGQFWSGPRAQRRLTALTSKAAEQKKLSYLFNKLLDPNGLDWFDESSKFHISVAFSSPIFSEAGGIFFLKCIQGSKRWNGETPSRHLLVTKKEILWTKYNLTWQIQDSLTMSFINFSCHFCSFSCCEKAAKISCGCFPERCQDLLDDPEGSQGFCLLNNVAIGAAYASGYPCGFPAMKDGTRIKYLHVTTKDFVNSHSLPLILQKHKFEIWMLRPGVVFKVKFTRWLTSFIENLVHRKPPVQIPPRKCVYRHVIHKVFGSNGWMEKWEMYVKF